MKIVKAILLIIILFNVGYPCVDIPNLELLGTQEISLNVNYHETEAEEDNCSPICSCECCSVASDVDKSIFIFISVELPGNLLSTKGDPISSSALIFQPPKYHI